MGWHDVSSQPPDSWVGLVGTAARALAVRAARSTGTGRERGCGELTPTRGEPCRGGTVGGSHGLSVLSAQRAGPQAVWTPEVRGSPALPQAHLSVQQSRRAEGAGPIAGTKEDGSKSSSSAPVSARTKVTQQQVTRVRRSGWSARGPRNSGDVSRGAEERCDSKGWLVCHPRALIPSRPWVTWRRGTASGKSSRLRDGARGPPGWARAPAAAAKAGSAQGSGGGGSAAETSMGHGVSGLSDSRARVTARPPGTEQQGGHKQE